MMMLMYIPMLLVAGFLLVTGAGGTGVILALVCIGMMAAMMFMMPGGTATGSIGTPQWTPLWWRK